MGQSKQAIAGRKEKKKILLSRPFLFLGDNLKKNWQVNACD